MAKNILIFFPHRLKESFGGAYTYLYQLKKAFLWNDVKLHFLDDVIHLEEERNHVEPPPSVLKKLAKKLVPDKAIYSRRIRLYLDEKRNSSFLEEIKALDLSRYDAIHFHETIDLWRCSQVLKDYKGTIVLTSHSPKPYHLELLEDVFGLAKKQVTIETYKKLEDIDRIAFAKADILVSPCAEAMESYPEHWPQFSTITSDKKHVFIPTGMDIPVIAEPAPGIKAKFKIEENAFVVCFNGRHNSVKGYDLLTEAAKILLAENKNVYFLITGKKDEPSRINHERWIETGWTTAPQDYIDMANLVVVPNRETYFDLNVLLALALGKPVLLSSKGGNRFFKQFNTEGIFYFEDLDPLSMAQSIQKMYYQRSQLASSGHSLQDLYQQEFSLHKFAERYHRFYLSI